MFFGNHRASRESFFGRLRAVRYRNVGLFGLGILFAATTATAANVSTITVGDASVTVIGGAPATFSFPLTRSGETIDPATVAYTTVDGSAIAGTDYIAASDTVTFVAGQASATVPVTLTSENRAQADKALKLLRQNSCWFPRMKCSVPGAGV